MCKDQTPVATRYGAYTRLSVDAYLAPHVSATPTETQPVQVSRAQSRESAEHGAEERVAPRCLTEGTRVRKEPRHARLSASRVEPIDEIRERKQSDVLCQCHSYREPAGIDGDPPSDFMQRETEDRSVQRMDCESRDGPFRSARDRLPQHSNIRIIAPEQSLVDRLLKRPHRRGCRAGQRRSSSSIHGLIVPRSRSRHRVVSRNV